MCEVFAMSSRFVENVSTSLEEFSRHGGSTSHHGDGWGIAFYEEGDIHLIREAQAASGSAYMDFIRCHEFRSKTFICHIRKATQGNISLKNTHPFVREMSGNMHVLAHNGKLGTFDQEHELEGRFLPVGESDTEFAFCFLLDQLASLWKNKTVPKLEERMNIVSKFARILRSYGPANFLYADGDTLFVHGDQRLQADGKIAPPGLFQLCRFCHSEKASTFKPVNTNNSGSKVQQVTLIASVPLTQENWVPLKQGELLAIQHGKIVMKENPTGEREPSQADTPLLAPPLV